MYEILGPLSGLYQKALVTEDFYNCSVAIVCLKSQSHFQQ